MTKRKRTRQNNTQKTNTCVTITQLKTEGELMCSGSVHSSYPTCGTLRVTLFFYLIRYWYSQRKTFV